MIHHIFNEVYKNGMATNSKKEDETDTSTELTSRVVLKEGTSALVSSILMLDHFNSLEYDALSRVA